MTTTAAHPSERAARGEILAFESRAMGSPLRLSVVPSTDTPDVHDSATRAWLAVRDEFEASELAMSRFLETSEVTRLNRQAGGRGSVPVSRRLRQALTTTDRARRMTAGRFDPRVLRDLERLGDHGAAVEVPSQADAAARPSGQWIELARDASVRIQDAVDLGGIGKGLALRWAAGLLPRLGVTRFLLDAGGDLVVSGEPPEGGPWRIGVEDPAGGGEPLAVLDARSGAVTTSSIRRRHWITADRPVHHLIDPSTGEPGGGGLLAVTVAGPDPAWSEIWSKALFLAGRAAIAGLARGRGVAAWWVTDDGTLEMTAGARERTTWVASEARGG